MRAPTRAAAAISAPRRRNASASSAPSTEAAAEPSSTARLAAETEVSLRQHSGHMRLKAAQNKRAARNRARERSNARRVNTTAFRCVKNDSGEYSEEQSKPAQHAHRRGALAHSAEGSEEVSEEANERSFSLSRRSNSSGVVGHQLAGRSQSGREEKRSIIQSDKREHKTKAGLGRDTVTSHNTSTPVQT